MTEELRTKCIIKSLIGAVLGMLISAFLVSFAYDIDNISPGGDFAVFIQFVGSGIMGAICNGGAVVYDIETWSLRKATVIHYVLCVIAFLAASLLLNWFDRRYMPFILLIFTLVYLFIWLVEFLSWKREIKRINRGLSQMIRREQEGEQQ